MESSEEVHSDDGSYELVNLDDYASDPEGLRSSSMDISESDNSYDFLCSEVSETLVLSDNEAVYMEFKGETHSESSADGLSALQDAYESDHSDTNSDSIELPVPARGKKRDLMTMLSESSDIYLYDFPAHIKLKEDIKELAKNHITRYLPAKSLFKCRQVSKEWNKWISSPFFAHLQSQYFKKTSGFFQNAKTEYTRFISLENSAYGVPYPSLTFLPGRVSVKSSCNGLLLCQSVVYDDDFFVCNPANRQWVRLPRSSSYHGDNPKAVLAFEPSSLNFDPVYQVICLFSVSYPDISYADMAPIPILHFDVYDSVTKSWKVSDMICTDLESDVNSDGIFVNGVVYWETSGAELLAYDLKNDIYSVQKLPFHGGGVLSNVLGEVCYVTAAYDHLTRSCVLDVYGDGVMSLKNSICVPVDNAEEGEVVECTVVGNSCGDVVAVAVKVSQGQKRLYVCHVKDGRVEGPVVFRHSKKLVPYVNSLVSLDVA